MELAPQRSAASSSGSPSRSRHASRATPGGSGGLARNRSYRSVLRSGLSRPRSGSAGSGVDGTTPQRQEWNAGMLRKLKVGKGWKQRYVFVERRETVLKWAKSADSDVKKDGLELRGATLREDVPKEWLLKGGVAAGRVWESEPPKDAELCFAVEKDGDTFVFATNSQEQKNTWLDVLEAKVSPLPVSSATLRGSGGSERQRTVRFKETTGGAERRLQIYGSLVCFRVQRVLIEWLRSDGALQVRPDSATVRQLQFTSSQSTEGDGGGVARTSSRSAAHQRQIEAEQQRREVAQEVARCELEGEIGVDAELKGYQARLTREKQRSSEQRLDEPRLPYFAGWLEVRGKRAAAPMGPRVIGRKGWRLQYCVIAGGFLLAFDQPEDLLSATAEVALCLVGFSLVTAEDADDEEHRRVVQSGSDWGSGSGSGSGSGWQTSDGSSELSSPSEPRAKSARPHCFMLTEANRSSAERREYLLNVPRGSREHLDPRLNLPPGDTKTTEGWTRAVRQALDVARRHASLDEKWSVASAVKEVTDSDSSLLDVDVETAVELQADLDSSAFAQRLGTKPGLENVVTALLCGAILCRVMDQMDTEDHLKVLRGMDQWFGAREDASRPADGAVRGSFATMSMSAPQLRGLPLELAGTLASAKRKLLRCGLLRRVGSEGDGMITYAAFLFTDIFMLATARAGGHSRRALDYEWHCPLAECRVSEDSAFRRGARHDSGASPSPRFARRRQRFVLSHRGTDWIFEVASASSDASRQDGARRWLQACATARDHACTVHRDECRLDRFEGAVLFADISGFSELGEELERRRVTACGEMAMPDRGPRTLAAEQLAKITDDEVAKMVRSVTEGGGDVIQFAGDCVIAVFPSADYAELSPGINPLSLATAQATKVADGMVQGHDPRLKQQSLQALFEKSELQELQADLGIHVAIGAGLVYGYHVGGTGDKWHYVIDGPAMKQVRHADDTAGGLKQTKEGVPPLVLSEEAFKLVNSKAIKERMRHEQIERSNVYRVQTFFPSSVVVERQHEWPWEEFTPRCAASDDEEGGDDADEGMGLRCALANKLRSYIPKPVVDQVEAGQTAWARRAGAGTRGTRKRISTMFCKIVGVDYTTENGERAVEELGALVMQIQGIVQPLDATMTRVSCDDKGTSAVILCDVPSKAVTAALRIVEAVGQHGPRFRSSVGITTGEVWLGAAGGDTRAEYTVHGSCVTFAARLMTCPLIRDQGGVLCDDATRRACGHEFLPQRPTKFKGYEDEIVVYMPVAARGAEDGIVEPALAAPLTPQQEEILRICAVVAMGCCSGEQAQGYFSAACVGAVADAAECTTAESCVGELHQLAARGELVPLPLSPGASRTAETMYGFSSREEMVKHYDELTFDVARGYHLRVVEAYEARLCGADAHGILGLPPQGSADRLWMRRVFEQLQYHAEVAQDWEKCDQFTGVLQWFDVLVGPTPLLTEPEPELESGA